MEFQQRKTNPIARPKGKFISSILHCIRGIYDPIYEISQAIAHPQQRHTADMLWVLSGFMSSDIWNVYHRYLVRESSFLVVPYEQHCRVYIYIYLAMKRTLCIVPGNHFLLYCYGRGLIHYYFTWTRIISPSHHYISLLKFYYFSYHISERKKNKCYFFFTIWPVKF